MKSSAVFVSLLLASSVLAADSQTITIDNSFESQDVVIEGKTFRSEIEYYTYTDTCYRYEDRSYQVCYDDSNSSSSGSSSSGSDHVSGRGTRYRDRRDDRNKDFEKACHWETDSVRVSYSCTQTASRTLYFPDGGMNRADVNVSVVNPEAIVNPFELTINSPKNLLGRDLKFSSNITQDSSVYLRKVFKEVEGEQVSEDLFKMNGQLTLEAIDATKIRKIINGPVELAELTLDGFTLTFAAKAYDRRAFAINFSLKHRAFIFNRNAGYESIKFSDLDVEYEGEKMTVNIPFSKFPYMKDEKRGTYTVKLTTHYSDSELEFPKYSRLNSEQKEFKFKVNFKKETIERKK